MFDKLTEGVLSVTVSKKQLEDYFHEELYKEDFDVVFNPPYTILKFKDGSETKVKCSGDNFDEYTGVMIALAKRYAPQSHTYIIDQVSKAIRPQQPSKAKELKIGDKVRPLPPKDEWREDRDLTYLPRMEEYVDKIGVIEAISQDGSEIIVEFSNDWWYYKPKWLEKV